MKSIASKNTWVGSVLLGSALVPVSALAGGISLYEIATPDIGLASAGYASRAQDASTVFKNPAGMNLLGGSQTQAGAQLLYGDMEFSHDASTSHRLGTDDGGNAIGALPGVSAFYVHELDEKWRVGFGTLSYLGAAQEYHPDWVGRYYVQESTLLGMSLLPTVSYQVTDWLSVGAGVNAMYGELKDQVALPNLEHDFGDGQMRVKDHAWGLGANAGVLIQASKETRVGINYLSAVDLDFQARPEFTHLGPTLTKLLAATPRLDLGVTVPRSTMVSLFHQLNEKTALMADVGWQNWEQFGRVQIGLDSVDSTQLTKDLHFQDTWHGAVGAQYQLCSAWRITGGVAYDSSAVDDADRTVSMPMGSAWRFGTGLEWQLNEKISLGAGYEFLWMGDMSIDQGSDLSLRGRVSGAYENASISFFTLNFNWKL